MSKERLDCKFFYAGRNLSTKELIWGHIRFSLVVILKLRRFVSAGINKVLSLCESVKF